MLLLLYLFCCHQHMKQPDGSTCTLPWCFCFELSNCLCVGAVVKDHKPVELAPKPWDWPDGTHCSSVVCGLCWGWLVWRDWDFEVRTPYCCRGQGSYINTENTKCMKNKLTMLWMVDFFSCVRQQPIKQGNFHMLKELSSAREFGLDIFGCSFVCQEIWLNWVRCIKVSSALQLAQPLYRVTLVSQTWFGCSIILPSYHLIQQNSHWSQQDQADGGT